MKRERECHIFEVQAYTHCNERRETYRKRKYSLNDLEDDVNLDFYRSIYIPWPERHFDCKHLRLSIVVALEAVHFLADIGVLQSFMN